MLGKKMAFEIASVYTAVIVGAGFVTGRELVSFFLRFGAEAFQGLLLSGAIMALVGWATLDICRKMGLTSFDELLKFVAGEYLSPIIKAATVAMLFVMFVAMLSAAGALGVQLLGLPEVAGAAAMAMLCFAALLSNLEGIVKINTMLAPIMVIGSIVMGVYTYSFDAVEVFAGLRNVITPQSWVSAAVLYASYNMITASSILAEMGVKSAASAFWGVLLGAGAVTIIAASMALGMGRGYELVQAYPVPFLRLVQGHGALLTWGYVAVLLSAIFTTAATSAYCFYNQALKYRLRAGKVLMCLAALLFSQVDFTIIVESVYPSFGLVGLLLGLLIVLTRIMRRTAA